MNREQQILTILYQMAMVVGGEVSVKPLLTKVLQRLLYYTSFPAGLVFLDLPAFGDATTLEARLDAAVGDFELGKSVGRTLAMPATLLTVDLNGHHAVVYSPFGLAGGWELSPNPYALGCDAPGSLALGVNVLFYGVTQ